MFGRQIKQYDIAITNFQTKYGRLPGDSPLFSSQCGGSPGDGDGYIGSYARVNNSDTFQGDIAGFWYALSSSTYLQGESYSYAGGCGSPVTAGQVVPKANICQQGQILVLCGKYGGTDIGGLITCIGLVCLIQMQL